MLMKFHAIFFFMLLCCCTTAFTQKGKTVSGFIKGGDNSQPLSNVTIEEKGTKNYVLSNEYGQYSIVLTKDDATLIFSFL